MYKLYINIFIFLCYTFLILLRFSLKENNYLITQMKID